MKNKLTWCGSYITEFTVCALCGWLYEEALELIVNHCYADRGMLHLPLLPVYGFFGLFLVLLFIRHNKWWFVFAVSTVATTVLELGCSYLLEAFGWRLWDYSDWPLSFEGRISVVSSLIFGVLSVILVKLVHPMCRRFAEKAPAWVVCLCGFLPGAVMLGDFLLILAGQNLPEMFRI